MYQHRFIPRGCSVESYTHMPNGTRVRTPSWLHHRIQVSEPRESCEYYYAGPPVLTAGCGPGGTNSIPYGGTSGSEDCPCGSDASTVICRGSGGSESGEQCFQDINGVAACGPSCDGMGNGNFKCGCGTKVCSNNRCVDGHCIMQPSPSVCTGTATTCNSGTLICS